MGCATGVDLVPESSRGVPYVSSKRSFCSIVSDHPCSLLRKRTVAAVTVDAGLGRSMVEEGTQNVGNGLYLLGRVAWSTVRFLVDTGSRESILATQVWNNWGRPEEGLGKYWGWLCSNAWVDGLSGHLGHRLGFHLGRNS